MDPRISFGRTAGVLLWLVSWGFAQEKPLQPTETLNEVWQLVDQNFFDSSFGGVDWPAQLTAHRAAAAACSSRDELAAVVNAMLAPLQASHTSYYSQDDPRYYQLLGVFSPLLDEGNPDACCYDGIGVATQVLDGKHFVSAVYDGHPAALAGLLYGDQIVAVDGQPFHSLHAFRGKAGQTVEVEVCRTGPSGPLLRLPVSVARLDGRTMFESALEASARVIVYHGRRIGYLHVWSYAGEKYHEQVHDLVLHGALRECEALIVDLRDGWGGANVEYLRLFLPELVEMKTRVRDGTESLVTTTWNRPVGLLINSGTTSGKEVFSYAFAKIKRGPLVGDPTAGAVLAGRCYRLQNGDLLYLAVADVEIDGLRLEGNGVSPTTSVARPLPFAQGADPQLESLLNELAKSLD